MISRERVNTFGLLVAATYIVLAPIMLQSSLDPILPGRLGSMQLADALAPLMLLWLFLDTRATPLLSYPVSAWLWPWLLAIGALFVALAPIGGLLADHHVPLAETLRRGYLAVTLVFFTRICRIEGVPIVLLWISVYCLALLACLGLTSYGLFILTGESNYFVRVSFSRLLSTSAGQLVGPMRPTEKLFATYLVLLSGPLFLAVRHFDRRVWNMLVLTVLTCCLLTFSRQGALGAMFLILSLVVLWSRSWPPVCFAIGCWGLSVAALEITAFYESSSLLASLHRLGENQTSLQWDPVPGLHLKSVAFNMWLENPMLGGGPENFAKVWWKQAQVGIAEASRAPTRWETPNSTYLFLLAEGGLVGMIAWLGLTALPLSQVRRLGELNRGRLLFFAWLATLALMLVDIVVINFRFLYFILPLVAFLPTRPLEVTPQRDL